MKKVLLIFVFLVVAAIVVGGFVLQQNLDKIIAGIIETQASEALGVEVTLEAVELDLGQKKVTLRTLKVGNPAGFSEPHAMIFPEIAVALEHPAPEGLDLHVTEIDARSPSFFVEQLEDGSNNFLTLGRRVEDIEEALPLDEDAPPLALRIDQINVDDCVLQLIAPQLEGGREEASINRIRVRDLEGDPPAVTKQIAEQLIKDVTKSAAKKLARKKIEEKLEKGLRKLLGD